MAKLLNDYVGLFLFLIWQIIIVMTKQVILRDYEYFVLSVLTCIIKQRSTLVLLKCLGIGLFRL